jgi:hypothetical protein
MTKSKTDHFSPLPPAGEGAGGEGEVSRDSREQQ